MIINSHKARDVLWQGGISHFNMFSKEYVVLVMSTKQILYWFTNHGSQRNGMRKQSHLELVHAKYMFMMNEGYFNAFVNV